jgi:hypothetical protein
MSLALVARRNEKIYPVLVAGRKRGEIVSKCIYFEKPCYETKNFPGPIWVVENGKDVESDVLAENPDWRRIPRPRSREFKRQLDEGTVNVFIPRVSR